jgi:DUF4097 and DUF4098 domain-containing protein YvlB
MKKLIRSLAFIAVAAFSASGAVAQESTEQGTVSFSDSSRPGEISVRLVNGSIRVKGGSGSHVTVQTFPQVPGELANEPAVKLHRLPRTSALVVEEHNNRIEISASEPHRLINLMIQAPARTNLTLSTVNQGGIWIEGVEGELELGNVNGSISLTDVSGSVVAHTVNGLVKATLKRVTEGKPMAFTSLNGRIEVTLPATTRANLKLRTDNGEILTDFDLTALPQPAPPVDETHSPGGRYRIGKNQVVYGSINGGGADIELRTFNGDIVVRKGI